MDGVKGCPPIDKIMVQADTIGGSYKNGIYDMRTYYANSMSLSSVSGASVGGSTVDEEVCEMVFKLNAELQAQAQWIKDQEQLHLQEKYELVKQFTDRSRP